jgi:glycogen debranching enzyme
MSAASSSSRSLLLLAILGVTLRCVAQGGDPALASTPRFALPSGALTIHQNAIPNHPFTVTGTSGAILGMQNGSVELWQFPLKFFSGLHLRAEVDGYDVPIDLNSEAASIDVSPDHTTITYSHAAITVRQHMFVPAGEGSEGLGGVVLFEIESIHPATVTISLVPAMVWQWPAPQYGQPSWGWRQMGTGGAYVIATDNPELFGMIGMAAGRPGEISPYQESPRALPLEFRLRYDPARDQGHLFPLLCEAARPGERNSPEVIAQMERRLAAKAEALPAIFARTKQYYDHYFDSRLIVHTPDPAFDKAMQWSELAIDKAQASTSSGETGLVAGWYPSFDSARPGFGWYFGRDTLWSLYAIDSYGDQALARRSMDFLIKRQRADGKMMHEYSLSADRLTGDMAWSNFPYEYAAADATPLYLLAMQDYVRATGDLKYLNTHWESLQRAYHFERTHDSDGDGVYDNSQGTGWVEGWPPLLPHQELYLAALDRDATFAMSQLALWMHDATLAADAQAVATKLAGKVEEYRRTDGTYAFSKNANGSYDTTLTVYPAAALWGSKRGMAKPDTMLTDWSAHAFATDWGTRAIAETDPVYDPISYHQGTVWPLFTGWTSMAEYRGGRPLAGFAALQRNVSLTWAQDPGSVTEVLSGRFYQPLGRSSTHQLWSSAMVLAPAVRGLFGIEPDAPHRALIVHPSLPASWDNATLEHVRIGQDTFSVEMRRTGKHLSLSAKSEKPTVLCLRADSDVTAGADCAAAPALERTLEIPLSPVEAELISQLPHFGDDTAQPRVINESYTNRTMSLQVEAMAGTQVQLRLRLNDPHIAPHTSDGTLKGDQLQISMPEGTGFLTKNVTVSW